MESKRIYLNQNVFYYQDKILGAGAFGTVYKGMVISKNAYAAIKKMIVPQGKHQAFKKEIAIMKQLKHPYVIELWDYEQRLANNEGYIVMELCQSGTLDSQIEKSGNIPEEKCLNYLKQIVDATAYVNSKNFIHRDLKSENILISKDQTLKICDFGVAKVMKPNQVNNMTYCVGTPVNMAPEVIQTNNYTQQCDVWSIGMIFYEMCTGGHYFGKSPTFYDLVNNHNKLKIVGRLELEGNYNPVFAEIIRQTIVVDPNERITIQKLKQYVDNELNKLNKNQIEQANNNVNTGYNSFESIPQPKKLTKNLKKGLKSIKIVQQTKTQEVTSPREVNLRKKNITYLQKQVDIKYKSQQFLSLFRVYLTYRVSRGQLFIDYSRFNLSQKQKHPQNKCQKFIHLAMCFAIYYLDIIEIQMFLKEQPISIPGEEPVKLSQLTEAVRAVFEAERQSALQGFIETKNSFMGKIVEVTAKFSSPEYRDQFKEPIFYFRNIIAQLQYASSNKKFKQNKAWFLLWFKKFYYEYDALKIDLTNLTHNHLRIYWAFAKLSNLQTQFPEERYQQGNLLGKFNDFYQKEQSENFLKDLGRMGIKW